MKKKILTHKKHRWAKNREIAIKGTRLNYNVSQQVKYEHALTTLVRKMTYETKKQIIKLFDGETAEMFRRQQKMAATMDASITSKAKKLVNALNDKFTQLFSQKAKLLAKNMVTGAEKTSQSSLHSSLQKLSGGLSLKTSIVPAGMEDVTKAAIQENVSLIKSLPDQYYKDVTGTVMRAITSGISISTLTGQLEKYSGQTERRAKNIALDQVRKAYNSVNKQRMQALGIKKFEWVHSGGSQQPRDSHIAMSGNIYSFDNLPVINKEQVDSGYEAPVHGIPGQAINCRCTMTPVVEFEDK